MNQKNIRIGIIPVKRDYTDVNAAAETRDLMLETIIKLKNETTDFIHISEAASNGILYEVDEIQKVADFLKEQKIDALFFLHCDFGCEEVIGRLAKQFSIPVLLWGPRDFPTESKPMGREVQCGIFASSRILKRYDVPFTYIVNSEVNSKTFSDGFARFQKVVSVVKAYKNMRILQVGNRPKPFFSVMANESELLKKFGIEIVPISDTKIIDSVLQCVEEEQDAIQSEIEKVKSRIDTVLLKDEFLERVTALKLVLLRLVEKHQISAVSLDCWGLRKLGCNACFTVGELTDLGVPVACETDTLGSITSVLLQAAMGNQKATFFADLTIRHPENDNAELLWHCGPFPYSLKHAGSSAALSKTATGQWQLQDGPITLLRMGEDGGEYKLFVGEGHSTEGPKVAGTYVWIEVDDWEKWEEKLVYGPYIHHVSGIFAHCKDVFIEAAKYIKGIQLDPA